MYSGFGPFALCKGLEWHVACMIWRLLLVKEAEALARNLILPYVASFGIFTFLELYTFFTWKTEIRYPYTHFQRYKEHCSCSAFKCFLCCRVVTNTATKTADVVSMKKISQKKTLNRAFFLARKGKRIRKILPAMNSIFCSICTYSTVSVHRIEFKACSWFKL